MNVELDCGDYDVVDCLDNMADELELEEKIREEIELYAGNFNLYIPTEVFYSHENIINYPSLFLEAAERIRRVLIDLNMNIERVRILHKSIQKVYLDFNENHSRQYKKYLETNKYYTYSRAHTTVNKLKFLMERILLEEAFAQKEPVSWSKIFAVQASRELQAGILQFEFIKKGSEFTSIKQKVIEQSKLISQEYFDCATRAIEAISFAEALEASIKSEKLAIAKNATRAAKASHNHEKEYQKLYLNIYEDKYKHLSNTLAAKTIVNNDLANNINVTAKLKLMEKNPNVKEPHYQVENGIGLWKRWRKATQKDLNDFLLRTREQANADIRAQN